MRACASPSCLEELRPRALLCDAQPQPRAAEPLSSFLAGPCQVPRRASGPFGIAGLQVSLLIRQCPFLREAVLAACRFEGVVDFDRGRPRRERHPVAVHELGESQLRILCPDVIRCSGGSRSQELHGQCLDAGLDTRK